MELLNAWEAEETAEAEQLHADQRSARSIAMSIKGLGKKFGDHWAVKDLDLDVFKGEFFGLLGPNGAGKTTTISMISGLIAPTVGEIRLFDDPLTAHSHQYKKQLAVVPQDIAIYPVLSCMENLLFFGGTYGLKGKQLRQLAKEALERVGLSDKAHKPKAGQLSGGQKRRLNIAASLMHDPQILILDEPTVGVDPQSRNYIFETLKSLNAEGKTIIYTSHYMEEVEQLCERVGIVDNGRMIVCDTLSGLLHEHGQAIIRLKLDNNEDIEKSIRCLTSALAEQVVVESEQKTVSIVSPKLIDGLRMMNQVINQAGMKPIGCEVLPPSLETVFLKLTGKKLRD